MEEGKEYKALKAACKMGEIMLKSGAEVYRVERTVHNVCLAYGINSIQCSVTPAVITAGFASSKGTATHMVRVKEQALNLHKVDLINELSRTLSAQIISLDELDEKLGEIDATKPYKNGITIFAAALGTGAFAVVFGGGMPDFFCGVIIGAVLRGLIILLSAGGFQDLFSRFLAGGIASMLAGMFTYMGFGSNWGLITVSALTLLFPGLLFTNALRDVATGDFISAVTHMVEAFSIAAALAAGAALVHGFFLQMGVL